MPPRPGMTVVVTGASAGVGRAVAVAFARNGWKVALIARSQAGLLSAKREVEAVGAQAAIFPLDVADAAAVFEAARAIVAQWGAIHVWVNNAMASAFAPVARTTPEEFRRITEVTYLGYVHGTMAAIAHMDPRAPGTIVQVGSALSYRAIPLQAAYCGAKFAVRGFTDALRSELLHERSAIRITMVQLPAVNTPQFDWTRNKMGFRARPLPPVHQPEAVAELVYRAALSVRRELWIGWPAVKAILGNLAAPALLDRHLASAGYSGQLTTERQASAADNLFVSPESGHDTHGRFDNEARSSVTGFNPTVLRLLALVAVLAAIATITTMAFRFW
jgi:short-subunit dehydrogenase